jgi:serine phosphatase RsbU (regulator of sigma subunit)
MALVTNLAILYAGLVLINTVLSAALWLKGRSHLHRALVLVWGSALLSYIAQGILVQSPLVITYSFATVFFVNLALASLVAQSLELPLRWRPFAIALGCAALLSTALAAANVAFLGVALPVAVAVALPSLVIAARAARSWRSLSIVTRGLVVSCILFSLHNIDFAFLRDRPEMAPLGFTVAALIVFALSITAPAVVLERVAERQARIDVELETARRIQTRLLPQDVRLPGLVMASYMRSAESVGGDFFDVHTSSSGSWLFLGDVTGHGIGAGLVTLMAQSTISSILETRPDIGPAELNFLANRILAANLKRMGEPRHLTFVAVRARPDAFLVSGSHDTAFIIRKATNSVEALELAHFPLGIGFLGDLTRNTFQERSVALLTGDTLFIGSDGITEAMRGGDTSLGLAGQFGESGLIALLRENATRPLTELKSILIERLDVHTNGVYHDDVSFVMVRTDAEGSREGKAGQLVFGPGSRAELQSQWQARAV